jgi:hypothetical protein
MHFLFIETNLNFKALSAQLQRHLVRLLHQLQVQQLEQKRVVLLAQVQPLEVPQVVLQVQAQPLAEKQVVLQVQKQALPSLEALALQVQNSLGEVQIAFLKVGFVFLALMSLLGSVVVTLISLHHPPDKHR